MTALTLTRHGERRMSQRGFRKADLEVLLAHGTDIGRDQILLRKRDAARLIRNAKEQIAKITLTKHDAARLINGLKKQIARIERLAGKVLVVVGGELVTAYHQTAPARPSFQRTRRPRFDRASRRGRGRWA